MPFNRRDHNTIKKAGKFALWWTIGSSVIVVLPNLLVFLGISFIPIISGILSGYTMISMIAGLVIHILISAIINFLFTHKEKGFYRRTFLNPRNKLAVNTTGKKVLDTIATIISVGGITCLCAPIMNPVSCAISMVLNIALLVIQRLKYKR